MTGHEWCQAVWAFDVDHGDLAHCGWIFMQEPIWPHARIMMGMDEPSPDKRPVPPWKGQFHRRTRITQRHP